MWVCPVPNLAWASRLLWGAVAVQENSQEAGWPDEGGRAGLGPAMNSGEPGGQAGPGLGSRHRAGGTLKKPQGLAGPEGWETRPRFPSLGWCVDADPWKGDWRAGVSGHAVQVAKGQLDPGTKLNELFSAGTAKERPEQLQDWGLIVGARNPVEQVLAGAGAPGRSNGAAGTVLKAWERLRAAEGREETAAGPGGAWGRVD